MGLRRFVCGNELNKAKAFQAFLWVHNLSIYACHFPARCYLTKLAFAAVLLSVVAICLLQDCEIISEMQ